MLVLKSESERGCLRVWRSACFPSSLAAGGIWLWSQVADRKPNDSELDLCSGSHLTNLISPVILRQWFLAYFGPREFCTE